MKTTTDINGVVSDALVRRLNDLLLVNNATGISAQQIFDAIRPNIGCVWFPIDTAPMDGTIIALWCEEAGDLLAECQYYRGAWRQWGEDAIGTRAFYRLEEGQTPTHWMKLLPPNIKVTNTPAK